MLDGGSGADTLTGGAGNDTYLADQTDTLVEVDGDGADTVVVTESYTLAAGVAVETLELASLEVSVEDFEGFSTGAIADGENGWKFVGGVKDQEVVADPNDSGNQVFRMSSDPSVPDFSGPYSPSLGLSAGEPGTTADADSHAISFDFRAVSPTGDNSRLEVDFGRADGTDRNNFLVVENVAGSGVRIAVADPLLDGNFDTGNGTLNQFAAFTGNRTLVEGMACP